MNTVFIETASFYFFKPATKAVRRMKHCAGRFFICLLALTTWACAGSGRYIQKYPEYNLSENEDRLWDLSSQELTKIAKQGKFESDSALEKVVNQMLLRFLDPVTRRHFPVHTKLLFASEINAFTFGNGTIVVSLGMAAFAKNLDMLAFVIGHETAHLNHRDGLQFYNKMKSRKTMLNIGSLLPGIDLIVALATAGSLAGFSREQELAADSYAIQTMVENNFQRDAGQEVMQLFDDLLQFLQLPKHTFLASHPNSTARYDNLQANLANHPVSVVNKFSFARINYDSLVANSRAKVGKILLQQKQYDFLDYFLQHYAHVGWEAQSALLKAELIYETAKDSSRVLPSVIAALRTVKNPEVHVEYFRILGLTYFKEREWRQGKENLERYLALKKSAKDRLYIEGLIKRCEENER